MVTFFGLTSPLRFLYVVAQKISIRSWTWSAYMLICKNMHQHIHANRHVCGLIIDNFCCHWMKHASFFSESSTGDKASLCHFFFLRWGIKWSKSFLRKVTALISILLLVFLLKNKFLYHFINLTSLHKHTYKLVKPCQAHNVRMFL